MMTIYVDVCCPKCGHLHDEIDFTLYETDLWPRVYNPCDAECGHIFCEWEMPTGSEKRNDDEQLPEPTA